MNQSQTFKILLVGDGGVGKTSFIKRYTTGNFSPNYVPTTGVDIYTCHFNTNYGRIVFYCWDVAGHGGLRNTYYINSDGAIIMFDVTSPLSYKNMDVWYNNVVSVTGKDIPIVVCGNKVDIPNKSEHTAFHDCQYYNISAKSNYNYEKPFLYLARQLTGKGDLEFITTP